MIKLYDFVLSGNCQKVRLMLSILGVEYEKISVDLRKREQMQPEFLAINPLNKVPVMKDGDFLLRDSSAILVYLARKYGSADWYPEDPEGMGEVQQWLSLAVNEIFNGCAVARALIIFKREGDLEAAQNIARKVLHVLEDHFQSREWLALSRPTIADIACYPYVAMVEQGKVSLEPYPAVRSWIMRVESLPGYVGMEGLPYSPSM